MTIPFLIGWYGVVLDFIENTTLKITSFVTL